MDNGRIPVFASFADIGKNVWNSYGAGFELGSGSAKRAGSSFAKANNIKSVGGALSSSLGLMGIGATIGASVASFSEQDPVIGGVVGGAVGALGLPAAGVIGGAAFNLGKAAINGAANAAPYVGAAAKSVTGVAAGGAMAVGGVMGASALGVVNALGDSMISYKPTKLNSTGRLSDIKFSGLGKGLIGAGMLATGVKNAASEYQKIKMGQKDNYVTRATPRMPAYNNNAGATGDLVFALNNLRRG